MAVMRSWVESANDPLSDFPLANLPYGIFRHDGGPASVGVAIGDRVLDLRACARLGLLEGLTGILVGAAQAKSLNALMAQGRRHESLLRERITGLLADADHRDMVEPLLLPMTQVEMLPPAVIGDYTDFYASIYHATNVGRLFRPDHPLLPNYKWVPIGYHGRASSIVASGAAVRRPCGQVEGSIRTGARASPPAGRSITSWKWALFLGLGQPPGRSHPHRGGGGAHLRTLPGERLVGARRAGVGVSTPGAVSGQEFRHHDFALGGDHGGAGAVPSAGVRAGGRRSGAAPVSLAPGAGERGAIDLKLEVRLSSRRMRADGIAPLRVSLGNLRDLYWTPAQLVAHHASNGCNLRPGDLLATGTVSGPDARFGRLPAGNHAARGRSSRIAERRDAPVPGRWRRGDHPRMV